MSGKVTLVCGYCGELFEKYPSQIVTSVVYCSRECATTGKAKANRGEVKFVGDTVLIPLTKGQFATIDRIDYDTLDELQEPWMAQKNGNSFYAWKWIDKVYKYMHIYIMNPPDGYDVHHKDENGLNNKQFNLVVLTRSIHKATIKRRINKGTTPHSKYRGVTLEKRSSTNPWMARITIDGVYRHLGNFPTEEAAAYAYD